MSCCDFNDLEAWVPELDERAARQHSGADALLFKRLAVMDQRCASKFPGTVLEFRDQGLLRLVLADECNLANAPSVAQIAAFEMQVLRKPFVMPALRAVLVAHVDNEPDSIASTNAARAVCTLSVPIDLSSIPGLPRW